MSLIKKRIFKSAVSLLLVSVMVFGFLPPFELKAGAADEVPCVELTTTPTTAYRFVVGSYYTTNVTAPENLLYEDFFQYIAAGRKTSASSATLPTWTRVDNDISETHTLSGNDQKELALVAKRPVKGVTFTCDNMTVGSFYFIGVYRAATSTWEIEMFGEGNNQGTIRYGSLGSATTAKYTNTIDMNSGDAIVMAAAGTASCNMNISLSTVEYTLLPTEKSVDRTDLALENTNAQYNTRVVNILDENGNPYIDITTKIAYSSSTTLYGKAYALQDRSIDADKKEFKFKVQPGDKVQLVSAVYTNGANSRISAYRILDSEGNTLYYNPDANQGGSALSLPNYSVYKTYNCNIPGILTQDGKLVSKTYKTGAALVYKFVAASSATTLYYENINYNYSSSAPHVYNETPDLGTVTIEQENSSIYDTSGTVTEKVTGNTDFIFPVDANGGAVTITTEPKEGYVAKVYTGKSKDAITTEQTLTDGKWTISEYLYRFKPTYEFAYIKVVFVEKPVTVTAKVDEQYPGGSVSMTVDGNEVRNPADVQPGTKVTFNAEADPGYKFEGWFTADGTVITPIADGTYTYTINADTTYYARFIVDKFDVSAGVLPGCQGMGTVTREPADGQVDVTTTVTFTATANPGYEFVGWYQLTGDDPQDPASYTEIWGETSTTYSDEFSEATTIVAKFAKTNVTVTLLPGRGEGKNGAYTVTGEGIDLTLNKESVKETLTDWMNKEVTLTITATDEHYNFKGWAYLDSETVTDVYLSADTVYTTTLAALAGKTIYPVWEKKASVAADFRPATTGGSYTVDGQEPGASQVFYEDVTLVATPDTGYRFVAWVILDSENKVQSVLSDVSETTLTTAAISGKKITAVFEYMYVTITLPGVVGGSYTIAPATEGDSTEAVTVNGTDVEFIGIKGNSYKLTYTLGSEQKFVKWIDADGNSLGNDESYTIVNLSSTSYAKPVFADMYVTITLPGIEKGSYTVTQVGKDSPAVEVGAQAVEFKALTDTRYVLKLTLDPDYGFEGWYVGEQMVSAQLEFTIDNLHNGVAPRIKFAGVTQSLSGTNDGKYTLQLEGAASGADPLITIGKTSGAYNGRYDLTYVLTAIPDEGYHFVAWVDAEGNVLNTNATWEGFKLQSDRAVRAVFSYDWVRMVFQPVEGGSYIVTGEGKTYTVTSTDVQVTGRYDADYTITFGTAETDYGFDQKFVDGDGNVIATGNSYTFRLTANLIIKPLVVYTGLELTLGAVKANGSYELYEDDVLVATVRDTEQKYPTLQTASYKLVAKPDPGYKFVRWVTKAGRIISDSNPYTERLPKDIVPVFVPEDCAMYVVNGYEYDYLDQAIAAAGTSGTVLVKKSGKVYGSAGQTEFTIPAGIKMVVPHGDTVGTNGSSHTRAYACETQIASYGKGHATPNDGHTYVELTVPENVKLTVRGVMYVGGTTDGLGAPAYGYAHANVKLSDGASIVVASGGHLSACGFIYGDGTVEVSNGGNLYVPFAIDDFRGGGYTVGIAAGMVDEDFQSKLPDLVNGGYLKLLPFSRYSMTTVQSTQIIKHGATVTGYVDLYAGGQHNNASITVIGHESKTGLFNLNSSDAEAIITYDASKTAGSAADYRGIGRTRIELKGSTSFGNMSITLSVSSISATINSKHTVFPIPYNYDIVIAEGGTFDVSNPVQMLPGATMTVEKGATLNVPYGSKLVVYNALHDYTSAGANFVKGGAPAVVLNTDGGKWQNKSGVSGFTAVGTYKPYLSTTELINAGFCGGGELIINGTMNINGGFGGLVQSNSNTGKIVVGSSATLTTQTQIGGAGYWQYTFMGLGYMYELAGATVHTLPAQVLGADGSRVNLAKNKTYYSSNKAGSISEYSYVLYYAASGNTTYSESVTENVIIAMQGAWCEHETGSEYKHDANGHWLECACGLTKSDVTPHSDVNTDADHSCDTCGRENITAHVDNDHDHACDNGCSIPIGAHTDAANDGDHVCDYCNGAVEGEVCVDANNDGDHKCDECGADNITVCGDSNKDHVCDTDSACTAYSTGDKEHKDGDDNNHFCDYCNSDELLTPCVDENPVDNKCDVCGTEGFCDHEYTDTVTEPSCGKQGYTTHTCSKCKYSYKDTYTDALEHIYTNYTYNNDATCTANGTKTASCDRGCGEKNTITAENTMLEHKDEDPKDHKCDECGNTISECVDANKDHVCDFTDCSNTAMGECVDNDHDHKCDYGEDSETGGCKEEFGTHADSEEDDDHVCDYGCKEVMEQCSDMTDDGNHNCDVCGKADVTEHTYADATCTTPKTCTECGATEGEVNPSAHKYIENVWVSSQEGHWQKCENCDHTTSVVAHSDNSPTDHKCDVCEFVMSECEDANDDNICDTCGENLAFTITFVDYFRGKTTATFGKDEAITFPTLDTESYSFNLEFMGWADATGAIVESATATENATYTAKYKVTGFKDGSLQMSVEYGAEGDIVLYITLFVYADTKGQFGAPAVLHDSAKVNSTFEFEFENQTIYMYKIGFTAEDIAAQGSYIYIQIGSGDGMYEEKINKVLFQYAAMLEHAGIVDGEANAENILKAQQTLIDSIIRYGGAVQDCFEEDHTDVTTHGMLTATSDILSGFDKLDAERIDRDDSNSAITTKFDAATGVFGTMISLEYYYTVSLNVQDATIIDVSVIVADSRAELEGLSEEFKPETALTAKRYMSITDTIENKEYYVSTTDGMTINEMEDKYAVIYVTYTVGDETVHYYGDIVEYGIERFAQRQVVDYSPKSVGGNGETVSADTYNTEQYVNMLLRILEANKAAKALEAEKAVTAD